MSSFKAQGNASGTGEVTLQTPNTNTNRSISLPDASTTLVGTDTTDTLTNKTLTSPTLNSPTIGGTPVLNASLTVSGTAQASTSGTSIDFTGIPSWAKKITVSFKAVSTNGTSQLIVQIGSGSFATTGYFGSVSDNGGADSLSNGFNIQKTGNATYQFYGHCVITLLGSNTYIASSVLASNNPTFSVSVGGGGIDLAGALDRVRVTTTGGVNTFDNGSINIIYE